MGEVESGEARGVAKGTVGRQTREWGHRRPKFPPLGSHFLELDNAKEPDGWK